MSFSDEIEFNMFPGSLKTHKEHVYTNKKVALLKAAAIYGSNGSGKSNFIKAIHFLHDVAVKGNLMENEIKCTPFRLDTTMVENPSIFGLECQIGGQFFEYTVAVQNNEILEETLHETFPSKGEEALIFTRKTNNGKSTIDVNPALIRSEKEKYRFEIYEEDLEPRQSLIFKIQDNLDGASKVRQWFEDNIWILYPNSKYSLTARLCVDKSYKSFLNEILPKLGTGMEAIDIESIPFNEFFGKDDAEKRKNFEEKLRQKDKMISFYQDGKEYVARKDKKTFLVDKVKTFNTNGHGQMIEFEPEEQSDGTRRILDLIPAIQQLNNMPAVFFIDEMDRSLHPSMAKELLRYFMSHPSKGQLIFTTHESNLLDLEIFRQDEIWFTEKDNTGATKIYPLSDFKPRYDLDIRKGYLAGRFGAVPFLGNLKDLNWQHEKKQRI